MWDHLCLLFLRQLLTAVYDKNGCRLDFLNHAAVAWFCDTKKNGRAPQPFFFVSVPGLFRVGFQQAVMAVLAAIHHIDFTGIHVAEHIELMSQQIHL